MSTSITFNADLKKAKGEPVLAAVYARYSSHSQTEQSIEGQLEAAKGYASNHGYTITREYCDRATTGRNDNREAFQRMLSDLDKHLFDVIITWKIDRIGRNREELAFNKHRIKRAGVRIEYVAENLPDSAESVILESVLEGMAEYYSIQLSTNVKRGMLESAKKLQYYGGSVPLGYSIDSATKRYVINDQEAPLVREIFRRYADGETESDILRYLNELGIKTGRGKAYGKSSLAKLLHNEKYTGIYAYKDLIRVEDGVPAIIDTETFEKVQELMRVNRRAPSHKWTKTEFILTGKLFCGHCGSGMTGVSGTSKTGRRYSYYICPNHRTDADCVRPVRQDALEAQVLKATRDLLADDELMNAIIDATWNYYLSTSESDDREAVIQNELKTAQNAIQNLLRVLESGVVSPTITARLNELESQKTALEISLREVRAESTLKLTRDHIAYFLCKFRDADLDDRACQRRLIQTFVNSVYVYPDKLKLIYNYTSGNSTVTLDIVEASDDSGGFVHCTLSPTKLDRHELFLLETMFMIIVQRKKSG